MQMTSPAKNAATEEDAARAKWFAGDFGSTAKQEQRTDIDGQNEKIFV